jgi:hypothetical protein
MGYKARLGGVAVAFVSRGAQRGAQRGREAAVVIFSLVYCRNLTAYVGIYFTCEFFLIRLPRFSCAAQGICKTLPHE